MAKLFEASLRAVIDEFKLEWEWYRMEARIPIIPTTGLRLQEDFPNIDLHIPIHLSLMDRSVIIATLVWHQSVKRHQKPISTSSPIPSGQ